MYDKSKKTWSQRLKIQKHEKTQHPTNNGSPSVASASPTTPTTPSGLGNSTDSPQSTFSSPVSAAYREATFNSHVAHNVNIRNGIAGQYQITPPATIMHLPLSDYHSAVGGGGGPGIGPAYDYMSGRALKYGEPWIYGTVRGIPARPAAAALYHPAYAAAAYAGHPHAAAIFAPTERPTATAAVAVVLCSCPEYLSGTKGRTIKKPSICKKCKGTRLPLANLGGTVRVQGSIAASPKLRPVGPSSTVRVMSTTKKQRPTILDPQKDPYDLMRRTRLLSPEPGTSSAKGASVSGQSGGKDKSRNRGKSASPTRGRSRTRHQQKALVSATTLEAAKAVETLDDSWLMEADDLASQGQAPNPNQSHGRKSILRCNVNPYDLISINAQSPQGRNSTDALYASTPTSPTANTSQQDSSKKSMRKQQKLQFSQNEFMPPNDDFNVQDAALLEDEPPPFLRQTSKNSKWENSKSKVESPRKSDEPQIGNSSSAGTPPTMSQRGKNKKSNYSNVQAIAGQRISLGEEQPTPKSLQQLQQQKQKHPKKQPKDQDHGSTAYECMAVQNPNTQKSKESEQSNSSKTPRPDFLQVGQSPAAINSEPKRPPRTNKPQTQVEMKELKTSDISEDDEVAVTVTVTPTYNIKSILKRPPSKNSENVESTQTDSPSNKSSPTSKNKEGDLKAMSTPSNSRHNNQQASNSNASTSSVSSNSQFYISLPQARKKVQFMVEEFEETETDCDATNDSSEGDDSGHSNNGELPTATNYEYYIRKRNQKRLHHQQQGVEDSFPFHINVNEDASDSEQVITYDEQFIQAMLLEKLQLDSQMVSKQLQQELQQNSSDNKTTLHINEDEHENEDRNETEDDDDVGDEPDELADNLKHGKTDYEDIFASNISETSIRQPQTLAYNVTSTRCTSQMEGATATIAASCDQQELSENPPSNTMRQSTTTKEPLPVASVQLETKTAASVMAKLGQQCDTDDEEDEHLPAKDKNITALIDDGENDADDDGDSDGLAFVELDTKDNNVPHDSPHVDDDDDGYEYKVNSNASLSSVAIAAINVATLEATNDQDDSNSSDVDGDDGNDDGHSNTFSLSASASMAAKAQNYGATKSTTFQRMALAANTSKDTDEDDGDDDDDDKVTEGNAEVKTKQEISKQQEQQQPQKESTQKCNTKKMKKDMQTLAAAAPPCTEPNEVTGRSFTNSNVQGNIRDKSGGSIVAGVKPTKETQSRKAIRRSQSERQPSSMTYLSNRNDRSSHSNSSKSDDGGKDKNNKRSSAHTKPDIRSGMKDDVVVEDGGNRSGKAFRAAANKTNSQSHERKSCELNFQDTMALRKRSQRCDTRDLFTMSPLERPREPPPPPPVTIANGSTLDATLPKATAAHLLRKTTHREEDIESKADAIESLPQTVQSLENKQQEDICAFTSSAPTKGKQTATYNNTDASVQVLSPEINDNTCHDSSNNEQHQQQMLQATNINPSPPPPTGGETTNGSKSSMTSVTKVIHGSNAKKQHQQPQRTVVRVAPFNKNPSNTCEVHRLKITHTDSDYDMPVTPTGSPKSPHIQGLAYGPHFGSSSAHYSVTDLSTLNSPLDYGQKKTSILITGDDCYSTMNLSCDDSSTPLYQSSVVVTDGNSKKEVEGVQMTNAFNTVTINVSSPRSSEDELILQHNQLNNLLKRQAKSLASPSSVMGSIRAIIPIRGTIDINLQRSASSTSSTSTSSMTSTNSSTSSSAGCTTKRGKTLIRLDYLEKDKGASNMESSPSPVPEDEGQKAPEDSSPEWLPHETELLKILRNPVEAVKRNLVPHICKLREDDTQKDSKRSKKMKDGLKEVPLEFKESTSTSSRPPGSHKAFDANSFIGKLLEDPMLNQVAEGLESDTVCDLIENSLKRLQESRNSLDMSGTKDNDDMNRLIDLSLKRLQEERQSPQKASSHTSPNVATAVNGNNLLAVPSTTKDEERLSNRGSISSANSFASAHNYELFDFDANESDCYQSCSSEINSILDDEVGSPETKSKFYQMLVDATLQEIELSTNAEDLMNTEDHQYESIRHTIDPIYEEISDMPPPLPLTAPPLNDPELEKKSARSIFEGASKYDILSYLVDAKERGVVKEEVFDFPLNCSNPIIIEEESADTLSDLGKLSKLKRLDTISSRSSVVSDSSEDNQSNMSSLSPPSSNANNFMLLRHKHASSSDIERNDSGVGSETSKTSRSKYLNPSHNSSITSSFSSTTSSHSQSHSPQPRNSPLHLCEDCDGAVETQIAENGAMFVPLVCRKCAKKRVERKEILTEIVETEEKYGRDLQIILEEFCHPMLVAGLLTQEQLSAIFLNTEELLENNQTLAERMRDALDIALEQGDDDLLTVNIGKIFLESTQMLHAFESYCVRQAGASLLLANLEKDKELLRIFLKVSQMENAVLRRMNLNSFLMVPVQRVTKYPLLLARLYKVTPAHLEGRDQLKLAQEKIELHLNHINQEAKDVPTKLWRRISSSSPNRRASCEIDMINIKLRKMAIDVLEWNHDEVRFVMEGKLLYTQPTDSNWKKARTIKLTSVNAMLVTNGKPSTNYKAEKVMSDKLNFNKHTGIREASLLLVKEKCGRYALIREPLYLDRCVVCSEADWDEYFEIQEISSKDTFIFKAEDNVRTKQWYTQLQYHAQGMGAWRKRRNALANIMINGMLTRS
ncbi:uncharacterized protein LOC106093651 [Stomoxys calcitrans]|uniref:uncharacterized protein LOC106093651 n=1 Tax=Stomoxys calcitrans TaxID=35570 RepID=UPI0027E2AEA8|nr:uncharacterized protein LOC106093651 [Stomoxys calcitrans]